jgi:hypothetical protein
LAVDAGPGAIGLAADRSRAARPPGLARSSLSGRALRCESERYAHRLATASIGSTDLVLRALGGGAARTRSERSTRSAPRDAQSRGTLISLHAHAVRVSAATRNERPTAPLLTPGTRRTLGRRSECRSPQAGHDGRRPRDNRSSADSLEQAPPRDLLELVNVHAQSPPRVSVCRRFKERHPPLAVILLVLPSRTAAGDAVCGED